MSDTVIKLHPVSVSNEARTEQVQAIWELACALMHAPVILPTEVPDRFLSTKKRHDYVFEQVPVGHDTGWRCYDPAHYDGDPADGDTRCGYGLTKDEAYVDYIGGIPATSAERELDEAIDEALDFDTDLEDHDAR
jgi:hypothetical protein